MLCDTGPGAHDEAVGVRHGPKDIAPCPCLAEVMAGRAGYYGRRPEGPSQGRSRASSPEQYPFLGDFSPRAYVGKHVVLEGYRGRIFVGGLRFIDSPHADTGSRTAGGRMTE